MDQSTFVSRLASRLNIDSSASIYASLDEYVNEGLHYLETAAPEGWPWYRQTLTLTTTASDNTYTFSTLGALITPNVSVSRVIDCTVLYQSSYYFPLDLINPEDATRMYGSTQTGIPEAWYAEGSTLYLYPTPAAAYTMQVRVVYMEPDLGGTTSTPVLPTVFHQAVIDAALLVAYQQLQDANRMEQQEKKVAGHITRMKRYGAQYSAAPRITVRDPLWA